MEWGRIKTVFIWLFLAINLFLGWQLSFLQQQKVRISSELIDDVAEVLAAKNVIVNKAIVPKNRVVMREYLFLPAAEGQRGAAERIFKTEGEFGDEKGTSYSYNGSTLIFSEQNDVRFTGLWAPSGYRFDIKGAKQAAQAFLEQLCDNDLTFELIGMAFDPVEEFYKMEFRQRIGDIHIAQCEMVVFSGEKGVTEARGRVVFTPCYPYEKGRLYDSFDSLLKYPMQEDIQNGQSINIVSIRPVYCMGERNAADVLRAGWEILAQDQNPVIFGAASGERIKN